jgi:hypothetical protein
MAKLLKKTALLKKVSSCLEMVNLGEGLGAQDLGLGEAKELSTFCGELQTPYFNRRIQLMKRKLNLIGILFIAFSGWVQLSFHDPVYLKDFDLKGKVKKVVVNDCSATKGEDGNVVQGPWIDSVVCEFNENGKLLSSKTYRGQKNPAITERYEYNAEGNTTLHVKRTLNTLNDSSIVSYKNGLRSEKTFFFSRGGAVFGPMKISYVYQLDQVVLETSIDNTGDTLAEVNYTYDDKGRMATQVESDFGKHKRLDLQFTENYSYDEPGNLIAVVSTDNMGEAMKKTNIYNTQGDVISTETKSSFYNISNAFEYNYDAQKNWVKCISLIVTPPADKNSVTEMNPQSIATRTIIYYTN